MTSGLFFGLTRTPYGTFEITASKRGIVQVDFPSKQKKINPPQKKPSKKNRFLLTAGSLLSDYFSGKTAKFDKIPVDWTAFSSFERKVFSKLLEVGPGHTITYGELAKQSQAPKAARAVGNALKRNPIPILIPCHRVVKKDHSLGGYHGGRRWKRLLLKLDKNLQNKGEAI